MILFWKTLRKRHCEASNKVDINDCNDYNCNCDYQCCININIEHCRNNIIVDFNTFNSHRYSIAVWRCHRLQTERSTKYAVNVATTDSLARK